MYHDLWTTNANIILKNTINKNLVENKNKYLLPITFPSHDQHHKLN